MNYLAIKSGVLAFFIVAALGIGMQANAVSTAPCNSSIDDCPPTSSSGSKANNDTVFPNPIDCSDIRLCIGNVIKVVLGLVGSLSLVIFIYGGLLWMTAAGNTERVTQGRNTLVWAVLGLVVIFSSYAIVNFLLTRITTTA